MNKVLNSKIFFLKSFYLHYVLSMYEKLWAWIFSNNYKTAHKINFTMFDNQIEYKMLKIKTCRD